MEWLQSDLRRLEDLSRSLAKAPPVEQIASDVYSFLQTFAPVSEVRIVAAPTPDSWKEWVRGENDAAVHTHKELPRTNPEGAAVHFDATYPEHGFLWARTNDKRSAQALALLAPQVWTAMTLRTALDRSTRSSVSERKLVRETLRSRDEERRHVARELHDDLGQSLVSLRLSLKWIQDIVEQKDLPEASVELTSARESVSSILNKIRDLSHTLYPNILDSLGLPAAIKELVYQATRLSGIKTECSILGKEHPVGHYAAVAIYRCCQEALNNAIRHAGASRIQVELSYEAGEIRVRVDDDGKGFEPGRIHDSNGRMMSSGFWTIRQRIADLEGSFRVSTGIGNGTVVEIIVPI
jgi:signal transduction histidine kinase